MAGGELPRRAGSSLRAGRFPPADAAGRTVYRVVQEGLTNVRKHAPGAAGPRHARRRSRRGPRRHDRQPAGIALRPGPRLCPGARDGADRAERAARAGRRQAGVRRPRRRVPAARLAAVAGMSGPQAPGGTARGTAGGTRRRDPGAARGRRRPGAGRAVDDARTAPTGWSSSVRPETATRCRRRWRGTGPTLC